MAAVVEPTDRHVMVRHHLTSCAWVFALGILASVLTAGPADAGAKKKEGSGSTLCSAAMIGEKLAGARKSIVDYDALIAKLKSTPTFKSATQSADRLKTVKSFVELWNKDRRLPDDRWLAYILATALGETTWIPVREGFAKTDQGAVAAVEKLLAQGRIKKNYARQDPVSGKSYFGRGYVQLTWAYNYRRASEELKDVLGELASQLPEEKRKHALYWLPDAVLDPQFARLVIFDGMVDGWYTKHCLNKYFSGGVNDWVDARRIINGTDKAAKFADFGVKLHAAITAATRPSEPAQPAVTTCKKAQAQTGIPKRRGLASVTGSCDDQSPPIKVIPKRTGIHDDQDAAGNPLPKDTGKEQVVVVQPKVDDPPTVQPDPVPPGELQPDVPTTSPKIAALEAKVTELTTQIATMTAENTELKQRLERSPIPTGTKEIAALRSEIASLRRQLASARAAAGRQSKGNRGGSQQGAASRCANGTTFSLGGVQFCAEAQ